MNLRTFYEHVLPPTGIYTLFRAGNRTHQWAHSLDELVQLTQSQGDAVDVYFAVATFDDATTRKQVNVDSKRAFYLDLDAGTTKLAKHGPDKVYATQRDALADVRRYIQQGGIQPTLIVSSGEGLHLYWTLTDYIPATLWTATARQFQKHAAGAGLKVDSAVTADSARVLRPVGTTHPNGKTVQVLAHTGRTYSIGEFAAAVGVEQEPRFSGADLSINDDVALPVQGPPKSFKKLLQHCGAARYAVANQEDVEEPYWRAMLGLTKHCVEGRAMAHAISLRHPDYDEALTDKKFDGWNTGPTTCTRLEEFRSQACAKCPHKGKVKSPVQLGAVTVEENEALPQEQRMPPPPPPKPAPGNPWDGNIPSGFDVTQYRGKQCLVHYMDIERENENGDAVPMRVTIPFSYEIFWLGHWADAAHADDSAQTTVFRLDTDGIVSSYTMDQSLIASRAEMAKFYAGKGIHTTTDKRALTAMEAYTKASLQLAKLRQRRPKISDRMGLTVLPDGRLISAHGKYAIMPDGTITETILSAALRTVESYYPLPLPPSDTGTWDASVWKTHIKPAASAHVEFMRRFYGAPGLEKYQLAFMLALASPFMAFVNGEYTSGTRLPRNGLTVSLFSKHGGRGKTTLIESAMMAYGRGSELSKDANNIGATALGRISRLSLSGTMPIGMDEMGSNDPAKIAELVSAIANGASRTTATKDGGLTNKPPWALIAVLAANKSARDMINAAVQDSDAIQYRLVELDVNNMPDFDDNAKEEFAAAWDTIRGRAEGALGAIIQLAICRMGARAASEKVAAKVRETSRVLKSNQVERFQYRGMGAMLVLQDLLDSLGLRMFDTERLISAFQDSHTQAVHFISENTTTSDPYELLSQALHDLMPYTVVTLNETPHRRFASQYDTVLNARMPDVVRARHVASTGTTYLSTAALKEWCAKHGARLPEIIGACKHNGVLVNVYPGDKGRGWTGIKNLMTGVAGDLDAKVACYAFNTKALNLKLGGGRFLLEEAIQGPPATVVSLPVAQTGT